MSGNERDTAEAEELRALRLEVAELRKNAEKFGLVWRRSGDDVANETARRGVGLVRGATTGDDGVDHILLEGDNLAACTALLGAYKGGVDVIYIDPPYNTGNTRGTGFTYSDRFRTPEDVERHSTWLSMMEPRLELARDLLSPTGAILISIDDNEVHHLRVLCDQVFGEGNFIAQMVWDGGNVKNNARYISGTHEYVLVYARSMSALREAGIVWREPRPGTDLLVAKYDELQGRHGTDYAAISAALKTWVRTAPLSARLKVFTGVDARGLYTYADLSAPGGNGARYDVVHPTTGLACQVPSRGWGYTEERMAELLADNRVLFGDDHTAQPMRKLYLADKMDQVRRSILTYPARSSTHLIEHMLGRRNAFNNPKNLAMLEDLIALVAGDDAVVLDFFAGSGTTGHAVLALNARDGGTRQFILATNNENGICDDVTEPRLAAAITGQWGHGRTEPPLGGRLTRYQVTWLRDDTGAVDIAGLAGLAELHAGAPAAVSAHTAVAYGPQRSVFCWDGAGRRADAQRALARFHPRVPDGSRVLLIEPADVETLDSDHPTLAV